MAKWIHAPAKSTNWSLSPEGNCFVQVVNNLNTFLTRDTRLDMFESRVSTLVSRVSSYLWAVLYAPKEHLHLDDTTIPTPAISYIATCSEVACCTIDQVTAIPMGLLHLGYLASHSSSFDQPRASQGVMLVETPSPHWKPPPATQDGTVRCASYYPGLAPASPTFSEVATHIPSRVPSWVKSSWRHPTDKAQSSRGPKPCPSVHCTWIGVPGAPL